MSGPELALLVEGFDPARGGAERAVRALAEAWAAVVGGKASPDTGLIVKL